MSELLTHDEYKAIADGLTLASTAFVDGGFRKAASARKKFYFLNFFTMLEMLELQSMLERRPREVASVLRVESLSALKELVTLTKLVTAKLAAHVGERRQLPAVVGVRNAQLCGQDRRRTLQRNF